MFNGRRLYPDFVPLNADSADPPSVKDDDDDDEEDKGNFERLVSALIWSNGAWAIFFVVLLIVVTAGVSVDKTKKSDIRLV